MRKKPLFFPILAALMLAGCSNDDTPEVIPPKVFTGDEAYISVKLADAGSLTSRATTENTTENTTKDPDYEYGSADEKAVNDAHFYFYDANKLFVSEGSAWKGGTAAPETTAGNIEFTSNTVVVLKGLTQKNYPKYMVTVLNKPGNFTPGQDLNEMVKTLSDKNGEGIWNTVNGTNYFTMSTTSYKHSDTTPYFVTEVKETNFSTEPIPETNTNIPNPVTVYVERLAAKVTVDVSTTLKNDAANTNNRYKITTTVAGYENNGANGEPAAEDLYVELLGWKLNATAKHSYMMKNIATDETTWGTTIGSSDKGFTWNDATNFRSYWGMSYNYGLTNTDGTYPDKSSAINTTDFLNYVNLKDSVELGKPSYCAENTNNSTIISANFPSAATSVLLSAKVCDMSGKALDLVRYNGVLYTKDAFLKYVLNVVKTQGNLNYWTTTDNTTYERIGSEFFNWSSNGSGGVVKVVFDRPAGNTKTIYQEENGSYSAVTDFENDLNDALANAVTGAIGYKGGLMYYNIPIEHLNKEAITEATNGQKSSIPEAKYGVVRNHHYKVTINKLENMGHGIFNPDEKIVPDNDDKKIYYVGASINILSWKIVSQSVNL